MAVQKREVKSVEVTYLCDACGKGMMAAMGEMDRDNGAIEHRCVICDHSQVFNWVSYPHIEHVGVDEDI